jgi:hypothetical protein
MQMVDDGISQRTSDSVDDFTGDESLPVCKSPLRSEFRRRPWVPAHPFYVQKDEGQEHL